VQPQEKLKDAPNLGEASVPQRLLAGVIGLAAGIGGTLAVFQTTNELGTAALFLVAGAFLICSTFGVVPTRLKVGDNEVNVGRAALHTLEKIVNERICRRRRRSSTPSKRTLLETASPGRRTTQLRPC
jgi:hypothetical protein